MNDHHSTTGSGRMNWTTASVADSNATFRRWMEAEIKAIQKEMDAVRMGQLRAQQWAGALADWSWLDEPASPVRWDSTLNATSSGQTEQLLSILDAAAAETLHSNAPSPKSTATDGEAETMMSEAKRERLLKRTSTDSWGRRR